MRRRDVLRRLSTGTLAAGAGALWSSPRLHAFDSAQPPQAPIKPAGSVRIRDVQTILTAPDGIRLVVVKVRHERAGPLWRRLRHVHTARRRRPDGDRAVPEAVPHRPRRRRNRGHLAVVLRELVLAQRPGALQRDERRRHRALGHQGQARRHARLPAARRQVPARRRLLLPRRRTRLSGSRGQRAQGHGARATGTSACRSSVPGLATYGSPAAGARGDRPATDRTNRARGDLGLGAVHPHGAEAVRAPAHRARRRRGAAARRPRARARCPRR